MLLKKIRWLGGRRRQQLATVGRQTGSDDAAGEFLAISPGQRRRGRGRRRGNAQRSFPVIGAGMKRYGTGSGRHCRFRSVVVSYGDFLFRIALRRKASFTRTTDNRCVLVAVSALTFGRRYRCIVIVLLVAVDRR